jgi:uncharacterized protein (DUF305 family)
LSIVSVASAAVLLLFSWTPAPAAQSASTVQGEAVFTSADVEFMQGMISHHAQAIEMMELVAGRTRSGSLRALAGRMAIAHANAIASMQEWLVARGQLAPEQYAHHHEVADVPGVLTPAQMRRLASANGAEFERLFLEQMISHHRGALTMVRDLKKEPGAARETAIRRFVSDLEHDHQSEIDTMAAMLQELTR